LPHQVEPVVTEESAADLGPSAAVGEISGQRPLHRSQPHSTTDTDTQEGTR